MEIMVWCDVNWAKVTTLQNRPNVILMEYSGQ